MLTNGKRKPIVCEAYYDCTVEEGMVKKKTIGTFTIENEKLVVTDPCYQVDEDLPLIKVLLYGSLYSD
ncbi:hypothetical protein [Bacillus sp. TL12]|uniref:hypothetical protein n=1 Tax=Bacillus sp. TL12 TaxID=2894756 RepID=UPI001F529000|nr:hypothetical protein [Bacillus sp. TL12]MCI0768486.1 hypothetical protein [Bacillus sp. TL12]